MATGGGPEGQGMATAVLKVRGWPSGIRTAPAQCAKRLEQRSFVWRVGNLGHLQVEVEFGAHVQQVMVVFGLSSGPGGPSGPVCMLHRWPGPRTPGWSARSSAAGSQEAPHRRSGSRWLQSTRSSAAGSRDDWTSQGVSDVVPGRSRPDRTPHWDTTAAEKLGGCR